MDYYYDGQFRRYIQQFARLFSDFKVFVGKNEQGIEIYQNVPIVYGDAARDAHHIFKSNSENKVNSTPLFAFYINGIDLDSVRRTNPNGIDTEVAQGSNNKEIYRIIKPQPIPYILTINLDLWTSNTEQKNQLSEQILILFNPTINLYTTKSKFDHTWLTYTELTNINWSNNPVSEGVDKILDVMTLTFAVPVSLSPPYRIQHSNIIEKTFNTINNLSIDDEVIEKIYTLPGKENEIPHDLFKRYNVIAPKNYSVRIENQNKIFLIDYENENAKVSWDELFSLLSDSYDANKNQKIIITTNDMKLSGDLRGLQKENDKIVALDVDFSSSIAKLQTVFAIKETDDIASLDYTGLVKTADTLIRIDNNGSMSRVFYDNSGIFYKTENNIVYYLAEEDSFLMKLIDNTYTPDTWELLL